jgi:Amt family ammonium transporter
MGWVDRNWVQLGYQIAGTVAVFAWSFTLTCIILFLLNLVPGLSLRASPEMEEVGMDDYQLGEFAYDYVEVTRHVSDLTETVTGTGSGSEAPTTTEKTVV